MRANSPITRRDKLLELLRSRTQADPLWTEEELAVALCCSTRSVRRLRQWLRDSGMLVLSATGTLASPDMPSRSS